MAEAHLKIDEFGNYDGKLKGMPYDLLRLLQGFSTQLICNAKVDYREQVAEEIKKVVDIALEDVNSGRFIEGANIK